MKLKKFNENDVDITANIKTNNIKDVEEFFDDVKKIHTKISNNDEEFTEDEDNELKYKTGKKFDEESNDNDTKLIVQDDNTKIKKFSEDNVTPDDYGYCPACDTKLIDEHCPRCKGEYDYDIKKLLDIEKEAIKIGAEYNKSKVEYILKLQKYINRIKKNYLRYKSKIKEEILELCKGSDER